MIIFSNSFKLVALVLYVNQPSFLSDELNAKDKKWLLLAGVPGGLRAKREAKSGDNSLSIPYRYAQPNSKYFCYKYEETN